MVNGYLYKVKNSYPTKDKSLKNSIATYVNIPPYVLPLTVGIRRRLLLAVRVALMSPFRILSTMAIPPSATLWKSPLYLLFSFNGFYLSIVAEYQKTVNTSFLFLLCRILCLQTHIDNLMYPVLIRL